MRNRYTAYTETHSKSVSGKKKIPRGQTIKQLMGTFLIVWPGL